MHIVTCPSCNSPRIKSVRRTWTGTFQGQAYTVPSLRFYECPECGERVYDREAMRTIEARSPAFARAASTASHGHAK